MGVHIRDERGELGLLIDVGLDVGLVHRKVQKAGTIRFEERLAHFGANLPVAGQRVDVGDGDAAVSLG